MEIIQIVPIAVSVGAVAVAVIQHLSTKSKLGKFKSLSEALAKSQEELDSHKGKLDKLKADTVQVGALLKDQESRVQSSLAVENESVERIKKLNGHIAELQASEQKSKKDYIDASEEVKAVRLTLDTYRSELGVLEDKKSGLVADVRANERRLSELLELEKQEATLLQKVQTHKVQLDQQHHANEAKLKKLSSEIKELELKKNETLAEIEQLAGRIDLYSRLDEYTRVGHFEMPEYLYETSERYQVEIKEIREQQKALIKDKKAITYPDDFMLCTDASLNKRILDGQVVLMLGAFNIECDLLLEKVRPSNLDRTLEQIEKKAEQLEKSCATMRCGFNLDYIELKYEECRLQYEYLLKKQEEQEEQRLIREQMKEEARVQRQYEEEVKEAEKEELRFRRLLDKAREHLSEESEQEKALSMAKISLLEEQLREAQERGVRAQSMAEQTRRGFVYVISNIGAFGEGVYKIGLTRRLDPQERVDELGDASVPFTFDVHAMCFSEDAPTLEKELHKRFASRRVNAVNFRKEFFRVPLNEIKDAIEELVEEEVEFKVTAVAKDYYDSRRLMADNRAYLGA